MAPANETRQRIVEAIVELHEEIGPAATTVTAIADRAGVQRLTVYRHFPDDLALLGACSAHWFAGHPLPDPASWAGIPDPRTRLESALNRLYGFFRNGAPMLESILLAFHTWRSLTGQGLSDEEAAELMVGLVGDVAAGSR